MKTTYKTILQNYFHRFQAEVSLAAFSTYGPDWQQEESPEFHRFWYVHSGCGRLEVGGRSYTVKSGQLYILPAGSPQAFDIDPSQSVELYWCHFRAAIGDMDLLKQLNFPIGVDLDDHMLMKSIFTRMIQAFRSNSLTRELRLRSAMLEVMATYLEYCDLHSVEVGNIEMLEKMDPVLHYIEEHLADNIGIDELAKIAYLHPNYFIVFFKNAIGCSPIQYVNNRRLENAKRLLEETKVSVSDVARQVGMKNHYLSRLFKRDIGLTPSRYRQLHQLAASGNTWDGREDE
ncbi:AraC family transcriptional regulator [Paenibacillus sp. GCM10027626]|uniref:AraC family transcriptional regulator n=1 Tax=Paenibacillus sp. GCM10027626 TaxID=3273411 RepID=UPI0036387635